MEDVKPFSLVATKIEYHGFGESKMKHQWLLVLFAFLSTGAHAQWLNYTPPGTPRTPDGKFNLTAPAPRSPDGKPDLTGVWMHEITTVAEVRRLFGDRFESSIKTNAPGMEIGTQHKYNFDILLDYKPEAEMLRPGVSLRRPRNVEPESLCRGVAGLPAADLLSEPVKIVQAPRETMILYEVGNVHRQVFTDGRALPREFDLPAFLGYSVGRWEGDTFVVETAGFNDKTALDGMGHPHSDALRLTERFRRRDFGHLDWEMTFDDPKNYTRPFTIKVPHDLVADNDIFEMFCENEKDSVHLRP
jgi:hypothetical protein